MGPVCLERNQNQSSWNHLHLIESGKFAVQAVGGRDRKERTFRQETRLTSSYNKDNILTSFLGSQCDLKLVSFQQELMSYVTWELLYFQPSFPFFLLQEIRKFEDILLIISNLYIWHTYNIHFPFSYSKQKLSILALLELKRSNRAWCSRFANRYIGLHLFSWSSDMN